MLFRAAILDGIRAGRVTLAFRHWRRPTVRGGGTLRTPVGHLHIGAVDIIDPQDISEADARRAGHASRKALLEELQRRDEGDVYRIEFGPLVADPRIELRRSRIEDHATLEGLQQRIARLDRSASGRAWTRRTLELLRDHPGVRAEELCQHLHMDKEPFKINVRKLKNMGLTISLGTGYRLSPRGETLLAHLIARTNA